MGADKTIPPLPPITVRPLDPAQHVAPAAHSDAAAHAAQAAGIEAVAQQAAEAEEAGREAVAVLEGRDPLLHPEVISPVMPEAPRRRRKRVRRPGGRKKKR